MIWRSAGRPASSAMLLPGNLEELMRAVITAQAGRRSAFIRAIVAADRPATEEAPARAKAASARP